MYSRSDRGRAQSRYGLTPTGESEGWQAMYEREMVEDEAMEFANRTSPWEVILIFVWVLLQLSLWAAAIVFVVWVVLAILGVG